MIEAVIFDMDGVIIDSEPMHTESNQLTMKEYGYDITEEEFARYIGTANREMWADIIERYQLSCSVEELLEKQRYNRNYLFENRMLKPIPGITELLEQLKTSGIAVGLASSSGREFIELVLRNLGIIEHFKVIVSGEEVKISKPAPDIFLKAAKELKVNPDLCLVIEDSCHGVTAAKAAGMKCIGFDNPSAGKQDLSLADVIVDSIKKIDIKKFKSVEIAPVTYTKKLWNPKWFLIYSALFSPIPVMPFYILNYHRTSETSKKKGALMVYGLMTLGVLLAVFLLPSNLTSILIGVNIGAGIYMKNTQVELFKSYKNAGNRPAKAMPLLALSVAFVAVALTVGLLTADVLGDYKTFGDDQVYYTDEVSEGEIDQLAYYLFDMGLFEDDGKSVSVKLDYDDGAYQVSFIIDEDYAIDDEIVDGMSQIRKDLQENVFDNEDVVVHITDGLFKVLKTIEE